MVRKIKVPKISANVTDATLTAWYKKEGESIKKGEPLLELTTEKAAFEIESPCNGILRKIFAAEKSVLPEGYVLALLGGEADLLPDVESFNSRLMSEYRESLRGGESQSGTFSRKQEKRVRATPSARRAAREKGIDLEAVAGYANVEIITEDIVLEYLKTRR